MGLVQESIKYLEISCEKKDEAASKSAKFGALEEFCKAIKKCQNLQSLSAGGSFPFKPFIKTMKTYF